MRTQGLLRPDCGGAGRGCGGRAGTFGAGVGWSQAGSGFCGVPLPKLSGSLGGPGERLSLSCCVCPARGRVWGKETPTPPPHPFLPSGGAAGCVEGPGQGAEPHVLGRKGLFEWRGEDGVSSKVEIEGTRPLGVRLQTCRYVAPVLCIWDMKS